MSTIGDNYVPKGNGSDVTGLDQSNIFAANDGKVGIGITIPSAKLDVLGDIKCSTYMQSARYYSDETNVETVSGKYSPQKLVYGFNEARGWGYNSADDRMYAAMNEKVAMVIDNNGSVGIGVNNPTNVLEIIGPLQYNTGTASRLDDQVIGSGTAFTSAMVGSIIIFNDGTTSHIIGFTDANHLTVADSGTVAIQSYGIYYPGFNATSGGNVGIGTTNPQSALEIKKAMPSGDSIGVNFEQAFTAIGNYSKIDSMQIKPAFDSNSGYFTEMTALRIKPIFNNVADENIFQGLIIESGNVGIGTTQAIPYQLYVKLYNYESIGGKNPYGAIFGETFINGTKAICGEANGASIDSPSSPSAAIYGFSGHATAWSGYFSGIGGRGVYVSNKVGIGTTMPNQALEVIGNIKSSGNIYSGGNNDNVVSQILSGGSDKWSCFQLGTDAVKGTLGVAGVAGNFATDAAAGDVVLRTESSSQKLFLDSGAGTGIVVNGGNVGIGCTDPQVKLDVNDNSIRIRTSKTPASASAAGTQGQIAWDSNYLYVCTATNTWKRALLSTW